MTSSSRAPRTSSGIGGPATLVTNRFTKRWRRLSIRISPVRARSDHTIVPVAALCNRLAIAAARITASSRAVASGQELAAAALLATCPEHGAQAARDQSQHQVIDLAAMSVRHGLRRVEGDPDDAQPASRSDRLGDRAPWGPCRLP